MPFKSESQRRYMYAKHPKIAKKFQEHTPKGKKLPEKVKKTEKAANASGFGLLGNLGVIGTSTGVLGAGLGYGASKLLSPSNMSIENLKREEQLATYESAIQKLKDRIAARKSRGGY